MFDPTEHENYYEQETENPQILRDISSENMVQPKVVFSVVGGYPWPLFFSEEFPEAKILSFDNNPRQIKEFENDIKEVTSNSPYLLDVSNYNKLNNILEQQKVELAYLSNIPDYLEEDESEDLAGTFAENETSWILFSHMTKGDRSKGYQPRGCRTFYDVLKDEGYKIKRISDDSTRYDISEYFLAISPKKAKKQLIEKLRKEQMRSLEVALSSV